MGDSGAEPGPRLARLGILISGGGTTLKNLIACRAQGHLPAEIAVVISSSAKAGGLEFARQAGIRHHCVSWREGVEVASRSLFRMLTAAQVDWVIAAGFLKRLVIPAGFENRVINIHPSLIPAFCGAGFYGRRVHQAVLDFGCKVSGCTVHFVDNEFDHGPIIAQTPVPVLATDSADELAQRVFAEECRLYPQVISALVQGKIQVDGRQVTWRTSPD